MTKGFVTFVNANEKYLKLNDILIESILHFTDLEVEVNAINFDFCHNSDRVISKRINLNQENFATICYAKISSSLTSNFDIGLQLDADMIVTPDIVKVFDMIEENHSFIKGSRHPWNGPFSRSHFETLQRVGGNKITQPYIHATYLFTKNSKNFLQEALDNAFAMHKDNFHPVNFDETILNCLLWKYEKEDCFVDCYDPYFEVFKSKIGMKTEQRFDHRLPYTDIENFPVNFYLSHGCKDPIEARSILNTLRSITE